MDDFIQVLVAIGIIVVSMLGGKKKRKKGASTTRPSASSRPRPRPAPRAPAWQHPPVLEDLTLDAERLERILTGGSPPATPAPPVAAGPRGAPDAPAPAARESAWEAGLHRPTASGEPEAAGAASHRRFHRLYLEPHADAPEAAPRYRVQDIRRAVIWKEILDPPVSLR